MEIIHAANLINAKINLENVNLDDTEKRNSYVLKTQTTTFPFLETEKGNISESRAIEYFLCKKYKPEFLGENTFGKAGLDVVSISSGFMRRRRAAVTLSFDETFREDMFEEVEGIKKIWYKNNLSSTLTYGETSSTKRRMEQL